MNKILISLGSNDNSQENIQLCRILLDEMFDEIRYSEISCTHPYGKVYKNKFLNQLALAYTNQDQEDIEYNLKLIEKQLGRGPKDKEIGLVKIDVDLVKWNEQILKPEDWTRSYIVDLLPSISED